MSDRESLEQDALEEKIENYHAARNEYRCEECHNFFHISELIVVDAQTEEYNCITCFNQTEPDRAAKSFNHLQTLMGKFLNGEGEETKCQ